MEETVKNWNLIFPRHPISVNDLQNPYPIFLIEAYLEMFRKVMDIDADTVLKGPPRQECIEHYECLADLLPIMNVIKSIKELILKVTANAQVPSLMTLNCILSPTPNHTHSIFRLLNNFSMFVEERLREIQPRVDAVYDMLKDLEQLREERDHYMQEENKISAEKATRVEKMQQCKNDMEIFSKELQEAMAAKQQLSREYDDLNKLYEEAKTVVEQSKSHKESLLKDINKLHSEVVTDAEDVKDQHCTALQTEQNAKDKMEKLKQVLASKSSIVNSFAILHKKLESGIILLGDTLNAAAQLKELTRTDVYASSEMELQRIRNEKMDTMAYLEKLDLDILKDEEDFQTKKQLLEKQLEEARTMEKDALQQKEQIKKKQVNVEYLKAETVKYDNERNTIMERMNDSKVKTIEKILSYDNEVQLQLSAIAREVMKKK